ncbi:hypothetical protein [Nonomuraea maheshkhaliensis]
MRSYYRARQEDLRKRDDFGARLESALLGGAAAFFTTVLSVPFAIGLTGWALVRGVRTGWRTYRTERERAQPVDAVETAAEPADVTPPHDTPSDDAISTAPSAPASAVPPELRPAAPTESTRTERDVPMSTEQPLVTGEAHALRPAQRQFERLASELSDLLTSLDNMQAGLLRLLAEGTDVVTQLPLLKESIGQAKRRSEEIAEAIGKKIGD